MRSHVWVLWHNWIATLTLGKCTAIPCRPVPNTGSDAVQSPSWWWTWIPVHYCIHIQCAYSKIRLSDRYWHEPIDCCGEGEHYTCTVKARSVGVWRQISDTASFWIRPEYVVDWRSSWRNHVVLLLMYSLISYKCDNCCSLLMACCGVIFSNNLWRLFFVVAHVLKPSIFRSHLWKLLKEEMHPLLGFLLLAFYSAVRPW